MPNTAYPEQFSDHGASCESLYQKIRMRLDRIGHRVKDGAKARYRITLPGGAEMCVES